MAWPAVGILASLALILLLPSGCATGSSRPKEYGAAIEARELVKTTRSWDGSLLPAYPQGQPEISIRRITIPPGARLDTHRHPVINAGVLLSGQLTVVTLDGKTLQLRAGEPIVELVNTWHYGINHGREPAEILVVYAGAVATPVTVLKP